MSTPANMLSEVNAASCCARCEEVPDRHAAGPAFYAMHVSERAHKGHHGQERVAVRGPHSTTTSVTTTSHSKRAQRGRGRTCACMQRTHFSRCATVLRSDVASWMLDCRHSFCARRPACSFVMCACCAARNSSCFARMRLALSRFDSSLRCRGTTVVCSRLSRTE